MRSKKTSGIYKIENIINNKVYVGSSVSIEDRWIRHKTDLVKGKSCSIKLQNSYNKHGVENFEFSILEECEIDNLIEREQHYIDTYNSYNEGYNCRPIANNSFGVKLSDETKEKMRESAIGKNKGKIRSDELKQHLSEINKGKKHTEESKNKISEAGKNRKQSEETKNKLREINLGKNHTEESKKKISESNKGKSRNKGKIVSEETREKLRILNTGRNSPHYKSTPILQYDLEGNLLKEWRDLIEVNEAGFRSSNVSLVCRTPNRTAFGFIWKFKE